MGDTLQVAIVGGGNFGTAMANIIAGNGFATHLWMRDPEQVADVARYRENRRYLPGHPLHDLISPTGDLEEAVTSSHVVFVTVPSASFRAVSTDIAHYAAPGDMFISATKGIEAEGFTLMSDILAELCGDAHVGVISGPNLAEEIAAGHYTGTVVASRDEGLCALVQELLKSPTFRTYASHDVFGVELGGALKNIYAIVCGMAAALGVGQNTIGMLITRSLAEMSRFAVSMGANPFTFLGLAGVGDLLVTCTSPLSRNYQVGFRVAKGQTLDEAMNDLGKLAEGVNTLKVVQAKREALDVYMPLVEGLHQVLFEGVDLGVAVETMMSRGQGMDVEFAQPAQWSYTRP
jgi:glycerol-3-phosphate dehydrogenase (NAD(P)+)